MATEIRVPTLGESVSEATVGTWFKKVGDAVKADEILCELETDKVTVEVPAPASGTLSEIVANAGDTVAPGWPAGPDRRRRRRRRGARCEACGTGQACRSASRRTCSVAAPAAAPAAATAMLPAPSAAKLMADNNVASAER